MTFTWDDTDLSTDLAKLRSRLGDTDSTDQLLTDEQIASLLTLSGDSLAIAAVKGCQTILAKLARKVDRSGNRWSTTRSQMFQHYKDLLIELTAESGSIAPPSWGELSIAGAEDIENDTDINPPAFAIGRDDND